MSGKSPSRTQVIIALAGAVAAVAGAIGAILALAPKPPDPTPVGSRKAVLRVVQFEPLVTLGDFAERFPDRAPKGLTDEQKAQPGGIEHLDLDFRNYPKMKCALTWTAYDAANDGVLEGLRDRRAGTFVIDGPSVQFTPPVWIPAPSGVEDIYIVFRLADGAQPCGSQFKSEEHALR